MRRYFHLTAALLGFFIVINGAFIQKYISLSLCSILIFNSTFCGNLLSTNQAVAFESNADRSVEVITDESESVAIIAVPDASQSYTISDQMHSICILGVCAGDVIRNVGRREAINQLRNVLEDEIPIVGSEQELLPSVRQLSGEPFSPISLYLPEYDEQIVLPPGDYEIPAHFYCTKVYTANGSGNRYVLASLQGRMTETLSALYRRASRAGTPHREVQVLSWSIQTGVPYRELPPESQSLVDELIPDYRDQMSVSFFDQVMDTWNTISDVASLPSFNEVLDDMGFIGDVTQFTLRARNEALNTNFSYQPMVDAFVINQNADLPGGTEITPWSQVNEGAYMRFIAPSGAFGDGVVQMRVEEQGITIGEVEESIYSSVGIAESSGSQSVTVTTEQCPVSTLSALKQGSSPEIDCKRKPLLVFYGGSGDASSGIVRSLKERVKDDYSAIDGLTVKYYSHQDGDEGESPADIYNHLKLFPNSPLVLVGHSWGGDTAHDVAEILKGMESNVLESGGTLNTRIQLLVTLDPVSLLDPDHPLGWPVPDPEGTDRWVNVWVTGRYSPSDLIATIGDDWDDEENADQNFKLEGVRHDDAFTMYRTVSDEVFRTLQQDVMNREGSRVPSILP